MGSIYSRIDKNNNKKYYGSIYHNGKRIRKFLGNSKELAEASLKKLEYELLFNIQNFYTKYQIPSYEKAILSFLKEVERTSVKFKQVSDIDTKLNYFKNYCFSIGISDLDAINRNHANTYIVKRSQTKLAPATLNMEFRFIKRFFNYCIMMGWMNSEFIFNELQTSFQRRKCTEHLQSNFEPDFVRKNNINLHTFRHTYAHNMLNKGVPKEVLQTLLGHRSIKTTEIYANWVRKEELERWV